MVISRCASFCIGSVGLVPCDRQLYYLGNYWISLACRCSHLLPPRKDKSSVVHFFTDANCAWAFPFCSALVHGSSLRFWALAYIGHPRESLVRVRQPLTLHLRAADTLVFEGPCFRPFRLLVTCLQSWCYNFPSSESGNSLFGAERYSFHYAPQSLRLAQKKCAIRQ